MSEHSAPYEFHLPGVLRVGVGAHTLISEEALRLGRRVLVVTDANCARIPEVAATIASLREVADAVSVFDAIPGEPTTREVSNGLVASRAAEAEVVVGLGGGAVLDTAKAIAIMDQHAGTIGDYAGRDRFTTGRRPLILAPTTAGTGSEATRYIAITESATNVKMLITDWSLLPDVAIVDPLLVAGSPRSVTASSGIDAITHGIEAYVSRRHQPTSDLFALGGIQQLNRGLQAAWQDGADISARAATAIGALHTGIAFSNSSVALIHGMSRPIGAYFHIPHGLANAMLLPTVTAWSLEGASERYATVARALGLTDAGEIPDYLARLNAAMKVPRLRDVVPPERLMAVAEQMARDAIESGSPANNPRAATIDDIVRLYEVCVQA